jgi:hypothetical protein
MTHLKWDRVGKEERMRRYGSELAGQESNDPGMLRHGDYLVPLKPRDRQGGSTAVRPILSRTPPREPARTEIRPAGLRIRVKADVQAAKRPVPADLDAHIASARIIATAGLERWILARVVGELKELERTLATLKIGDYGVATTDRKMIDLALSRLRDRASGRHKAHHTR